MAFLMAILHSVEGAKALMYLLVCIAGLAVMSGTARAQSIDAPPYNDAQAQAANAPAIAAVASAIPTPYTSTPVAPTPAGTAGTGGTYLPGNAAVPSLTRATTVTTGAGGAFSVTWATPLVSATPVINLIPINTGSQPVICNVTARSASAVSGSCSTAQTTSLAAVTVVGISVAVGSQTVAPTTAAAAGMSVMVFGREPTQ